MRRVLILLALLLVAAGSAGCGPWPGDVADDGRVHVVATTNIVGDLARQVGGDRVRVTQLMAPGVDPHLYKASAGDVRRLRRADLVLFGGLELEGRMEDLLREVGERQPTAAVTDAIPRERLIALEEAPGRYDPHVWFDPSLWALAALHTGEELAKVDPAGAGIYRARAARFAASLRRLGREADRTLGRVPPRSRVVVTSHDAFAYFGRRFGFDVAPIQGVSTVGEASTADVDRVARIVADRGLGAVFVESSVPTQTIDAVLAAARERGQAARVGEELFSDSAGDAGTVEATYAGMLRHNVRAIAEGLS
ncbi:MAG: zinc ABC transporter substrate-binding protein [Thermoleophilia bacterium]|nr:zinc ABC transporter substrate-binding protein [Thermoleophilia bacterium]